MLILYRIIAGLLFYLSLPIALAYVLVTGKHRRGLAERFGLDLQIPGKKPGEVRIWLHAASVGEVQAARSIVRALMNRLPVARIFVTTMTVQGKAVAKEQLPANVACRLAPLDVPFAVDRFLTAVAPDLYVCLETELWPLLLHSAADRGVRLVLINGRMSEKSFRNYLKIKWLIKRVLRKFTRIAVITEADRRRYLAVGVDDAAISVEGNVKYDLELDRNSDERIEHYRSVLNLRDGVDVFISGSTHTGEEELLLPSYRRLRSRKELVWIIAPRHLDRLSAIATLLQAQGIGFDRFTALNEGRKRRQSVVLVDTLGDLAAIYAVGTFIFCGGSLVPKGGHNLIEPAVWDKAVFYGPYIGDFRDAAELLESVGAGFPVGDADALEAMIDEFRRNPDTYREACRRGGDMARKQQGAARRQTEIVLQCLEGRR